jgi:hypothetical protein
MPSSRLPRPWRRSAPGHALPALGYLVGDLLALLKGPKPGVLYVGVVDENVPAPVVRGDEALALLLVEVANRSLGHMLEPFSSEASLQQKATLFSLGGASIKTKPTFYYPNHTITENRSPEGPGPVDLGLRC